MMLKCSALARAALGARKHGVNQVTRTLSQLSLQPQSALLGSSAVPTAFATPSLRSFATRTATKTRKPAARSSTVKRTTKKKPVAKKKPAARKKAKKPAPKPKKRVISEKAKAANEKKKALVALRELRAAALVEPKGKPATAWLVFTSEKIGKGSSVTDGIKSAAADFRSLDASEREHYNHIANQNKEANQDAYAKWIKQHTPEQIRQANLARANLKRKVNAGKAPKAVARGLYPLKDDRQIKRPTTAYFKFSIDRRNSGDFKGISLGESARLITKEWKETSASEKKKYEDLHVADKERYIREYERTYGKPPPSKS